ncbi:MAG: AmmeMemoRadiSam system radical SAM enzyme [Deltaproteobacteria bacterium]|nr:AmmeMemoRadiSam system radical SAM enzyme [Deltaproteobacteria bacterium]
MREALFWDPLPDNRIRCRLCRFRCVVAPGGRGRCRVRENRDGRLYSLVYGRAIAEAVDPIEKKPLFHVLPGSRSYSIATVGCNFRCLHCQNASISQPSAETVAHAGFELAPEAAVERAAAERCATIAYTYTEPTVFFEYAWETAKRARAKGLRNVFVTNGYISEEALTAIAPVLDAANVDLKGFSEQFYRQVTGGSLSEVLESLRVYKRLGIWLEITTLIIPGLNDSDDELRAIAGFIASELGAETPWHVTAFYPTYQMLDRPRTPAATLRRARELGLGAGLQFVYEGNLAGEEGEHTFCPGCGEKVIERSGFSLRKVRLSAGKCGFCGQVLAGIWG